MMYKDWNIEEMTGYTPMTTYYQDFSIADRFGMAAVKDTFKRATGKDGYASSDYKVMTELVMVLNWKIWEHYETNVALAKVYNDLWEKAQSIVEKTFTKEQLSYYYRVTD